ncbi:YidC/Oxa1 family membrane protein insertase [bacterium]|nr:YidC/Oxa1 family membrane protein insertase [bacterium]
MLATIWNTILTYPVLNLMAVLYHLLWDNLGLAIIVIASISRLALIPLTKNQTEMTRKMASLKPELDKLQKKYANNSKKLSEEQMKLYKKEGYNPLGCVGSLVPQLIILSVLIGVIRAVTSGEVEGLYDFVLTWVSNGSGEFGINPAFLGLDLTLSYNELSAEFGRFAPNVLPYLGLALVVGLVQFVATKFTTMIQNPDKVQKKKGSLVKGGEPNVAGMQESMQSSMLLMFPIMTIFITVSAPAALGLYWIVQSFMLIVQYFIIDFDKSKKGVQNVFTMFREKLSKK